MRAIITAESEFSRTLRFAQFPLFLMISIRRLDTKLYVVGSAGVRSTRTVIAYVCSEHTAHTLLTHSRRWWTSQRSTTDPYQYVKVSCLAENIFVHFPSTFYDH